MRLRPEERERGLALLRALIENGLVRRDVKSGAYHRTGAYSVKRLYETALNEWSTPTPRRSG
jgi:hypothetical protein